MPADDYDEFADSYERENASSLLNAFYERPTVLRLIGDVRGRRVLDVGCGSGPLSAELHRRGAAVTGFDGSRAMIDLARRRVGPDVTLTVHDLADPLPFADASFEDAVASLVLHYLDDWSRPLRELHRVLVPGGRLIISVNHPTLTVVTQPEADYFATRRYSDEFDFDGSPATLTFWHRPLHAMTTAFRHAGFRIVDISEPPPAPETPSQLLPDRIRSGERSAFIAYLFFVLEAE